LKFKDLLKKKKIDKGKNSRRQRKCYNYGKASHWTNKCPNEKKLRTSKVYNSKPNNTRFDMKGKEEALELDEVVNVVEDEMQNNDFKENVDFFETIVANLKTWNRKNLANFWYFDYGTTKHVSRDKANFKALENFVKIQNMNFVRGQIHGVYGKGKVKLFSSFGKINTIANVLYVLAS
jgi:hypothetical protein